MRQFLSRQLNIRPDEWPRVTLLYVLSFTYVVGIIWATIALHAAFLEQVGAEYLPLFFVVKALLSMPAVALYTAVADRWSPERLFILIFLSSVAAFALGLGLLAAPFGGRGLLIAFMYLIVFIPLSDIQAIHWNTYVNHFYDTRAARRIIPVLVTAFGIASVVAGEGLALLTRRGWDTLHIVLASMGLLLLTAVLIALSTRLLRHQPAPETAVPPASSYRASLREGYRYVLNSPFLRWMALAVFILMVLFTFSDYVISQTLAIQLTESEITRFLGRLTSITNLLLLPVQILFLNRLVGRIGLGNANLLFPLTNLAAAGTLFLAPARLWPAAVAQANRVYLYGSVGYPLHNLLYNAVPLRIKGRARAFIGGLVTPVGMLIGSILLQSLQLLDPSIRYAVLSSLIAGLSVAYALVSLVLRRQYARALIAMLEQEDYTFLLNREAADLRVTDPAALRSLAQKLAASRRPELTTFLVRLLADVGGGSALPILLPAIRGSDPAIRATLLETLAAAGLRGEATRQLYQDHLLAPDPAVRRAALTGLARWHGPESAAFHATAVQMLHDPDVAVRLAALPGLLRAAGAPHHAQAVSALRAILQAGTPPRQIAALRVLGEVGGPLAVRLLAPFAAAPADDLRLAAALALEALIDAEPPAARADVLAALLPLAADPVARVRQTALAAAARQAGATAPRPDGPWPVLLRGLADPSPQVRDTAVSLLTDLRQTAVAPLRAYLPDADPYGRRMALLALARIQPRQFDVPVNDAILADLRTIYQQHAALQALAPVQDVRGMPLLISALQEENLRLLADVFTLLTAFQPPAALQVIRDSLRSDSELVRANAAEALESITSPQTAVLIVPLLAPAPDPAALTALGRQTWQLATPTAADTLADLLNGRAADPWLRTIATFVVGEIGAAFSSNGAPAAAPAADPAAPAAAPAADSAAPTPEPEAPPARRARRQRRAADLLNLLTNDQPTDQPPTPTPPHPTTPTPPHPLTPTPHHPTLYHPPPAISRRFKLPQVLALLQSALNDADPGVRQAAQRARHKTVGGPAPDSAEENAMLSILDRILFLKEVPFFQGMTVDQLRALAGVCDETFFPAETQIYQSGDPGGELFVVVNGRVALEQPGQRKGSVLRLGTVDAYGYFGEMNLFNDTPRDASARAIQDTLTLRLQRAPLLALIRRHPDLSLELINVLSRRLQEAYAQIASRTRSTPRELHKLFDQLDE